MKLRSIIVEKAILPHLVAHGRDGVIGELVQALVDADAVGNAIREDLVKAIIKRENRGSTGFGKGVAVPHVKHPEIDTMAVAIGISAEGIDFKSLDGKPVHAVFLLLSPEDRPEEHLDAMEAIFGNLNQDTFRRFLGQAETIDEVLTLLQESDEKALARES